MHVFTVNKESYDETQLNKQQIEKLISHHSRIVQRIKTNQNYYEGSHAVLMRNKKYKGSANNKIVCNHAKEISDTATGYFLNSPISYSTYDKVHEASELSRLQEAFDVANVDETDSDNAQSMSVCGVAYEYVYVKENTTDIAVRNIEATNTFLVYDDTIEQNLLFGVYYYCFTDAITDSKCYRATVCTKNLIYEMILECNGTNHRLVQEPVPHLFGNVPIVEYRNNKLGIGDFEQQISLIDAYNTLMSDRVNDKEQFVESLLVLYGTLLGDDGEEVSEAMKVLKENGLLELPSDSKAEYLSRTFDENGMEILRKALKEDIYTFSHIPNLTDENFVGNSSGVAMEYKLLGLQMITSEKEKNYKKGLKRRIELFSNFLNIKAIAINPNNIKITFKRALPKNVAELAQTISNLSGKVSTETLISQLPFVEDVTSEIEKVRQENQEKIMQQQEMFKEQRETPFYQQALIEEEIEE